MDIQRLRNLTTGILHTEMKHIYSDLEMIIGEEGLMTHMLPHVMKVIDPWLHDNISDSLFWDNQYDPTHVGEIELPTTTSEERKEFHERYLSMPNPFTIMREEK